MLKNIKLRTAAKRLTLAALVIITVLLQNTYCGCFNELNIGLFPAVPLCVSIAMFEKETSGMFFGILTGALLDISSNATDGVYALLFALTGLVFGLLTHYIFRNTLKSAALFTATAVIFYCITGLIFNCVIKDSAGAHYYVTEYCCPSAIATLVIFPLSYYAVKLTERVFREKDKNFTFYD